MIRKIKETVPKMKNRYFYGGVNIKIEKVFPISLPFSSRRHQHRAGGRGGDRHPQAPVRHLGQRRQRGLPDGLDRRDGPHPGDGGRVRDRQGSRLQPDLPGDDQREGEGHHGHVPDAGHRQGAELMGVVSIVLIFRIF